MADHAGYGSEKRDLAKRLGSRSGEERSHERAGEAIAR
jgi:hypothetical protein